MRFYEIKIKTLEQNPIAELEDCTVICKAGRSTSPTSKYVDEGFVVKYEDDYYFVFDEEKGIQYDCFRDFEKHCYFEEIDENRTYFADSRMIIRWQKGRLI